MAAAKSKRSTAKGKPRGRGFVKGQSGNPRGRVRGVPNKATADVRALAQTYTLLALATLASIMRDKSAFDTARVSAAKELLDRGHGKSRQGVDVTGAIDHLGLLDYLAKKTIDLEIPEK